MVLQQNTQTNELLACSKCDTLHRKILLDKRSVARCVQCRAILDQPVAHHTHTLLALALASMIMFVIANSFPIATLEIQGVSSQTTLLSGIEQLWRESSPIVAILIFSATILCPLAELAALIYLLAPLQAGRIAPGFNLVARIIQCVRPWAMLEVFMLGILITLVKLSSLAHVIPGAALFAFGVLTLLLTSLSTFNPQHFWRLAHAAAKTTNSQLESKHKLANPSAKAFSQ
ncbi:MAG: paraquat-inducible protein A [Glomeribacter sp. 1016415]|nr:paraquat-inducible protein A [Glomeribacter sp. 1016415]